MFFGITDVNYQLFPWFDSHHHKTKGTGSVISFIHSPELYQVINTAHSKVEIRREALKNSIEVLNKLSAQTESLEKQIQLIQQLMRVVLHKLLE